MATFKRVRQVTTRQGDLIVESPYHGPAETIQVVDTVSDETTGDLDIYVSTQGQDTNPGTAAQPMRTIAAAWEKVPKSILPGHRVRVLVAAGTYVGPSGGAGMALTSRNVDGLLSVQAQNILGQAVTDILTANTGLGDNTIGSTALSLATDAHVDFWIEWLDANNNRIDVQKIFSNTSNTYTVCENWFFGPPISGQKFRVIRPDVVVQGTGAGSYGFRMADLTGGGAVQVTGFEFSGSPTRQLQFTDCTVDVLRLGGNYFTGTPVISVGDVARAFFDIGIFEGDQRDINQFYDAGCAFNQASALLFISDSFLSGNRSIYKMRIDMRGGSAQFFGIRGIGGFRFRLANVAGGTRLSNSAAFLLDIESFTTPNKMEGSSVAAPAIDAVASNLTISGVEFTGFAPSGNAVVRAADLSFLDIPIATGANPGASFAFRADAGSQIAMDNTGAVTTSATGGAGASDLTFDGAASAGTIATLTATGFTSAARLARIFARTTGV